MKTVVGAIIICLFLPISTCKADSTPSYAVSNTSLHADIVKKQAVKALPKTGFSLTFVSTAEAAVPQDEALIKGFEKIMNAVSEAGQLDELKPVLVDKDFEFLKAKVKSGVSQNVVLAILQWMHPQDIRIIDSRVEEDQAEFVVTGHSALGPEWGQIRLVKLEGSWKIKEESWYVGKASEQRDGLVAAVYKSISDINQHIGPRPGGPVSKIASKAVFGKGPLTKFDNSRRKRAFMFVFPMNNDKADSQRPAAAQDGPRARIHGVKSIKMSLDQKVSEKKYSTDFFDEKDDDRYSLGEWNIVIPNGKPHEVTVSWLWSF